MRWMKLEPITQSEASQKEKHQYNILTHIYGIYKDGNDNPQGRPRHPTPVLSPGKSHGQRRLVGCSPWGLKKVRHDGVTEQYLFFYLFFSIYFY